MDLIENRFNDRFHAGRQGSFDRMPNDTLDKLTGIYPKIRFHVLLERLVNDASATDYSKRLILPEEIESARPGFLILKRNEWMVHQADYGIVLVARSFGSAVRFSEMT